MGVKVSVDSVIRSLQSSRVSDVGRVLHWAQQALERNGQLEGDAVAPLTNGGSDFNARGLRRFFKQAKSKEELAEVREIYEVAKAVLEPLAIDDVVAAPAEAAEVVAKEVESKAKAKAAESKAKAKAKRKSAAKKKAEAKKKAAEEKAEARAATKKKAVTKKKAAEEKEAEARK